MAAEWTRLCKGARDLRVEGDTLDVRFAEGGRHHVVSVEDTGDAYRLVGIVARRGVVTSIPDLALRVWRRNRTTALTGFRIDAKMRLLGESWVPKVGLEAEEFQLWVRTVAAECDRLEHALTGRDDE
jgi:hypothetical protein